MRAYSELQGKEANTPERAESAMSFTPDEIQAFNTILEQKLAQHRREMERVFELRMHAVKRDLDSRLQSVQQEISRALAQGFGEQNRKLRGMLGELVVSIDEGAIERGDAANTRNADEIETEIEWEDLKQIITQSLDERLQALSEIQNMVKTIEQLERILEAMQVSMTTNNSLLSNRLYHHQQLPLERAHPGQTPTTFQDTLPLKRIQREEGGKEGKGIIGERE